MTAVRFIDAERVRALRREAARLAARRPPGKPVSKMRMLAVVAGATLAAVACVVLGPRAQAATPGPASLARTPAAAAPALAAPRMPVRGAVSEPVPPEPPEPRYALVLQDATPLRGAPKAAGAPLAQLGQGELLELRGTRRDYAQVWDPARERGGYVRAGALRVLALTPQEAPELLAVVRFLRDRPGSEALGLGFAAAYLKAAPAGTIGADVFDAMGTMAERLAWHANVAAAQASAARGGEPTVAAQLEVAGQLGVRFDGVERDGATALCYDGDAFRRVLALSPTPEQAARAALALTRHDCIATTLPPLERWQVDQARAALLGRVPLAALPGYVRDRVRMRQAGVEAAIAFGDSRRLAVEAARGEVATSLPAVSPVDVQRAGQAALEALAAVDVSELADDDQSTYADAAMRVGAARWAAEPAAAPPAAGLHVVAQAGQPGETCVLLVDDRHDAAHALARRCTFATVWTASARPSAHADALALAVQPLEGWRELWMFRATPAGWTVQVLPPSVQGPGIGYVEFAGWVPGTGEVLAAREVRDPQHAARTRRTYELLDGRTLETERAADAPASLTPFYRWQDPAWRRVTVSLR